MSLTLALELLGGTAAAMGAVALVGHYLRVPRMWRRTGDFFDSWDGRPERPGVPAVPSFPERMATGEALMESLTEQVAELELRTRQLKRNGGAHLADAVHRTAEGVEDLQATVRENGASLHRLEGRVDAVDGRISSHRQRNEEQSAVLRRELEDRIERLRHAQQQRDAMTHVLHELGTIPPAEDAP